MQFRFGLRIALKKIHTSTFVCYLHPGKEARPETNHKRKIRRRKSRRFCFRKTGFVHSRFGTYYALLLGYFGLKFLPDIRHCVYWVLAEVWAPNSSHKIDNKFFIRHCEGWKEGSFVCETVWFFSWVNTHPFNLKFVAFFPKFSGDSWVEFQEKTIPGEFFRNFVQTRAILYQKCENRFCSLSVWDLLRLTPWVFFQKFLPEIRHCVYWVLAEIWASDSSHKIGNKFCIRHCQCWKEGSFVCETIWILFVGEYSSVWPEICRGFSEIHVRFLGGISGINYSGRIVQKFCANQGYRLPEHVKFRPNFCNFILGPYCAEKN